MTPFTTISVRLNQFNIDEDYLVHLAGEFYGRLLAVAGDCPDEMEFAFGPINRLVAVGQWGFVEGIMEPDQSAAAMRAATFARILNDGFKRFEAPPPI